ncbi:MAG: TldD protein, part of TldE/TldD proteolytic complex [Ktedonobacterales bacterium]|jgi:TldD protein|nr:MAG: TldD protein, part of TldE/TldD proteolytic complex [Ktedonobacterales bacterium]
MTDTLQRVIGELVGDLEQRFPYAAALLSGASGIQISDNGSEQSAGEVNPSRGVVFTVYDGAVFDEYASSDLDPDRLARGVRQWASGLTRRTDGPPLATGAPADGSRDERSFQVAMEIDPTSVPLKDKLALIRDIQQRTKAMDSRIVQAQVRYGDTTRESVYTGRGRRLTQQVTRTLLAVLVAVSDGSQVRYQFTVNAGTKGFEVTRISDEELRKTVDVALRLLEAQKIEPGDYDVVADSGVSGVIAHESFGHGVELDLFPKGRALSAQYLNKQVAAPTISMFDDPSVPGGYGSYFFDDEGEIARPVQILRDGVFVLPISDFASATYAPGEHTANGRRQDFTRKTYARMTNTFFAPGDVAPADMIAGVERGVYLRWPESGMEDPMGWGIQVTAHYGEEIVNGQLTGKLFAPVGITGYVPDVLKSITAVGSDFELLGGATCGKGHKEFVPVSSGGPHLRMKARLG